MKTKASKGTAQPTLPTSVKAAIEEQQHRVWRLHSLIECVRVVAESPEDIEDFGAAISGLKDYAHETFMALDTGAIVERAQAIEDEERGAGIRAAVAAGGSAADVEDIPTRQ